MAANDGGDGAAPAKGRFSWLIWPFAVVGLIAAGIYGYQRYQFDDTHIVTDNAQVDGKLIKVLAPERGLLETVAVKENQLVEPGTRLASLENRYYKLEVDRAQARLNALVAQKGGGESKSADGQSNSSAGSTTSGDGLAQAKLATAQANLEVIQAQLAEAQSAADQADAQLKRLENNRNSETLVQSQIKSAKANADQANAKLLTLQKETYAAQQQVLEAGASAQLLDYNVEEARAELAQAQLSLTYTEIRSPIKGNVTQMSVNPGMLVEQGQYLMTVVSKDDKWLVANIKETDFEKIRLGDLVDIRIDAFPGTDFRGVIESLSPAAGNQFSIIPRNNASGNFIKVEALIPVMIRFTEPLIDVEKLVPGMSAEVTIDVRANKRPAEKPKASTAATSPPKSPPASSTEDDSGAAPVDPVAKAIADASKAAAGDSAKPAETNDSSGAAAPKADPSSDGQ